MPLRITIEPKELWDERNQKFISLDKETEISLEHSLVSIAKWEARHKKIFLSNEKMNEEEILDYIRCMTLTQNVNPFAYYALSEKNINEIKEYIDDPMTATTFNDRQTAPTTYKNKRTSAEEIYYMMFINNVPVDFQKWHINRLLALLKVFAIKNAPEKKRSNREIMSDYAAINRANRAKFHTKG